MASEIFFSLSAGTQNGIDEAFNAEADVFGPSSQPVDSGGGFIPDNSPTFGLGGGFIADDVQANLPTHMKLNSVPLALRHVNLPADDEEVLSVFRNAASGWSSSQSERVDDQEIGDGLISRDDWRSVCAVLLENEEDRQASNASLKASDQEMESDEEYSDFEEAGSDDEDDEYTAAPVHKGTRKGGRSRSQAEPDIAGTNTSMPALTRAQRESALQAFSLFFPSTLQSDTDLESQKIMLKDIQRVSKVLGEKIKAEEMLDMVEAFSSSPDKAISFDDFGHIMAAANLL